MDRPVPQYHFDGEEFRPFTYDDLLEVLGKVREMEPGPRVLDVPSEIPAKYWPTDLRLRGWGKGGPNGK